MMLTTLLALGVISRPQTVPTPAAPPVLKPAVLQFPIETEADRVPTLKTGGSVLIKGGKVFPITGPVLDKADVLIINGKISQIGKDLTAPAGVTTIDATGKCVLPGLVDAHSHRGEAESNEFSSSAVPEVQIRDVLQPNQMGLWYDLANGITSSMLLHGSADSIGGQSIVIKHRFHQPAEKMAFEGAPRMVKFALGENVTGKLDESSTRYPESRAGVESVYRRAFADAKEYMKEWDDFNAGRTKDRPRKDLRLETLSDILKGKIWIQCHSYRQDEILMMVRLSQEFGFHIGAMQHALEAYKIAPEMAAAHVPASMFSEAWDYKEEVWDSIPMSVALCVRAGVLSSVNTDSFSGLAMLNLDAAKTMRYGISEADTLKLITINAAKQIGVDKYVGSLEPGKDGDISIWNGHPLSVYSRCDTTLIDGEVVFQRRDAFGTDATSTSASAVKANVMTQDLVPAPGVGSTFALIGATVHPISKSPITEGVVVVKDGKILAVGDKSTPVPADADRMYLKGMDIYPGLIDAGSDIGLNEVGSVKSLHDDDENGPFQPDLKFMTSVNPETVKIPIARCGGVTTATVTPTGHGLIGGQSCVIDLEGSTREQMALNGTQGLEVFYPEPLSGPFLDFFPPNVIAERNGAVATNRDAIKDYFNRAKRYDAMRSAGSIEPDAQLEAMRPYVTGAKPVVVHADGEDAIKDSLAWAKDNGLKIIIAGGAESYKLTEQLVAQKVPVIYKAPSVACPGENGQTGDMAPYDSLFAVPYLLAKAGVKFCLAEGDSSSIQDLPWAAGTLCAHGLTREQAMKAITMDAADILGCGDSIGSLDPGKEANMIVTDGDPLEITTEVRQEFIHGKAIHLQSHFTQLYRKYEMRLKK